MAVRQSTKFKGLKPSEKLPMRGKKKGKVSGVQDPTPTHKWRGHRRGTPGEHSLTPLFWRE